MPRRLRHSTCLVRITGPRTGLGSTICGDAPWRSRAAWPIASPRPDAIDRSLNLPTEPIGSIPRPPELIAAVVARGGRVDDPSLEPHFDAAVEDTVRRFEATGSPVLSDGEQRKYHNFFDYCAHGSPNVRPDGFPIPFASGHTRRMPRLVEGPFRYAIRADRYLASARRFTSAPLKQAVISPSALSLLYPSQPIAGYPRETFIEDLIAEHIAEVRACLGAGAHAVQIDFTEGRLAVKLDPTGELLASFLDLNNIALARFTPEERARLGVHSCPGGDRDSTHSADVDYADLLPGLLTLDVRNFYVSLAGEKDRVKVLETIRRHLRPGQRIFVGVVSPIDPRVETAEEVRDRVLEAARYIPVDQLGTTDDCGFSPFSDDTSTSRDTAFAKIAARVRGTELASAVLGA
jgi:5-methyltetrahydropteroyltriglutamate--homocysteine methyltransferase